jgi:hypothetical protein
MQGKGRRSGVPGLSFGRMYNGREVSNLDEFRGRPISETEPVFRVHGFQVRDLTGYHGPLTAERRNSRINVVTEDGRICQIWQG